MAIEQKKWRAVKQDPSSYSVLKDDCEYFTWRTPFVSRLMTQHLASIMQLDHRVPIDPSERSMHDEKVNCLWSTLEHVLQSPKGMDAINHFQPKGHAIPTSRPALQCFHFFEKISVDGETRSGAVQTQSELLHELKLSDKKFPGRAAFLASCRTQFIKWMRLKESNLDVDACRSSFFDAVESDGEFSRIAIQLEFSNKWAAEQGMTPSAAANAFFDELQVQAELLDSVDVGKQSGRSTRRANAHVTTDTTDDASQASNEEHDDEEPSDSPPHIQEELLLCRGVQRNFMNSRKCSEEMMTSERKQSGLLTPSETTPTQLLLHKPLGPPAVLRSPPSQTLLPHLLHCLLSPQLCHKDQHSHQLLLNVKPTVMPFPLRSQPVLSLSITKPSLISFTHPPTPPSAMTPPRSCRQMHLH